ncbi:MAG TPA: TIGR03016 family PEP-CTERM system-associated outer membrane protein [Burkholderiaceae bacterium]
MSLSAGAPAWAERTVVEPWASARITASDNAGLGLATSGRDIVTDLAAGVRVRAEGARLSLIGSASLESFHYARHTQSNEIVPSVDLTGRWMAIERFLFIEASARTTQTYIDPYGPGLTSTSTGNNTTLTQYSLSPFIQSDLSSDLHFRARSDNSKTKDYSLTSAEVDAIDSAYFGFHTSSLERDPVPLGWRLEAQRSETRYQGEFVPLITDVQRALVNWAVTPTARVGLRVGVERNNFLADDGWTPVYGGQAAWRPSERTNFLFEIEHRFFGNGLNLMFTHRMPWLAWDLRASRSLDTTPASIFDMAPTNNVAALLDAILTTRFPDPAARAAQVQDIISRQGLPASTTTAISILSPRLSVAENVSAGLSFLGVRNTVALNLFVTRRRDAVDEGPFATDNPDVNNIQHGATIAYTLRLTPTAAAGLTATYSRIKSIETASADQYTTDASIGAHLVFQLATKTSAMFGVSQRKLTSNVSTPGRETSAFAFLDHRF